MNAFVESWDTAEEGLFERWAFLRFMVMSGGAANAPVSSFAQDGYTFEFEKAQGFRMVAGEGEGVQQLPRGLSIGPFRLSVTGGGGE